MGGANISNPDCGLNQGCDLHGAFAASVSVASQLMSDVLEIEAG